MCTIGPASRSPDVLERLMAAGMNVARLNFSHGTRREHGEVMGIIRRIARRLGRPVAILQDLSGQKIRIGKIESGRISLESGALLILTTRNVPGDDHELSITHPGLPTELQPGDTLLLSDGALELEVLDTTAEDVRCVVRIGGPLTSYKGINLPTRSIKATSMTDKDREGLAFGIQQEVDYVALSFVKSELDVLEAKSIIERQGCSIPLIAKIEKHEALNNIDKIIQAVDGIMVARGDLGVETPLEKIPLVQKLLIGKSNQTGKPVITATQMLGSMADSPRPTRAEVADVANAVLDGSDALMLSEETATGKYPVETVATMSRIAEDAESGFPFGAPVRRLDADAVTDLPEAVGRAACGLAEHIEAAAIIAFTQSGSTARLVSKYRPRCLILAPTPLEETYRRLTMVWGVVPVLSESAANTDKMIERAFRQALDSGLVQKGQRVVITAGVPLGVPGATNLIKVDTL